MNNPTLEERILADFEKIQFSVIGTPSFCYIEDVEESAQKYSQEIKQFLLTTIQEVREEERSRILAEIGKHTHLISKIYDKEGTFVVEFENVPPEMMQMHFYSADISSLINPPQK